MEQAEFDEVQYVVARGSHEFEEVTAGCKVLLDLNRMAVGHGEGGIIPIAIRQVKVKGRVYAVINDNHVDCVDNRDN